MNIQELFEAMTDISDEYIEEAYNYQKASVFNFKKALSAVATIAVLVAVALAVHFYTNKPVSTQPSDKAVETSDYTKDFSATNSAYDLAAPAVIPKSPKRLKSKVKKQMISCGKYFLVLLDVITSSIWWGFSICKTTQGVDIRYYYLETSQRG